MPFSTREKLIYDPQEQSITNGFENTVQAIIMQEGTTLLEAQDIAPGEKKKTVKLEAKNILSAFNTKALNTSEKDFQSSVLGGAPESPLLSRKNQIYSSVQG